MNKAMPNLDISRRAGEAVAQIFNLCTPNAFGAGRRFSTCIRSDLPNHIRSEDRAPLGALPIENRRYSRLKICATKSTGARQGGFAA
jgi:hypothetical protein